jgi:hypothetical protein
MSHISAFLIVCSGFHLLGCCAMDDHVSPSVERSGEFGTYRFVIGVGTRQAMNGDTLNIWVRIQNTGKDDTKVFMPGVSVVVKYNDGNVAHMPIVLGRRRDDDLAKNFVTLKPNDIYGRDYKWSVIGDGVVEFVLIYEGNELVSSAVKLTSRPSVPDQRPAPPSKEESLPGPNVADQRPAPPSKPQ